MTRRRISDLSWEMRLHLAARILGHPLPSSPAGLADQFAAARAETFGLHRRLVDVIKEELGGDAA
jgi:hypothetical protein